MIRIRSGNPQDAAQGYVRHTAHIDSSPAIDDIWFMTPADTQPLSDDWLLPIAMVLGLVHGEDVHVVGCVTDSLLASMEEIVRIAALRAHLRPVRITAEETAPAPTAKEPRVLACFSGGVDAFYTALDPDLRIDDLLYVHGFEAYVHEERVLAQVLPELRAAAGEMGRSLRLVETNWRYVLAPRVPQAYFTTMPILFAIAHLMNSHTQRLVIPQTHDPDYELEDPSSVSSYILLWSTAGLEIIEHGHMLRLEKVRQLTESKIAMGHLRVCWSQRGMAYNCGRCGKCMRTRTHLKLLGAEGRCRTLPPELTLAEIRHSPAEVPAHLSYMDENIAEAKARGMTELAEAIGIQRQQPHESPTWRHAPRAKLARLLRRFPRSLRKRRLDLELRRLKRRTGHDHPFNYLERHSREGAR